MTPMYNLLDEPWLPVRLADGSVQSLGLLEVFRRCGEITALAETAPPSLIAEYRLLLAITHRALVHGLGSWKDNERLQWYQSGLPADVICNYLNHWRERFWLFHPEHPFMQVAALAAADETRDKRKPWTQIALSGASGNTPVVFDHAVDDAPAAISWQSALGHLLGLLQFIPGGLVKVLRASDKAGALVNTAAVLPVGATLSQTLVLALHRPPLPSRSAPDLPAWERPPLAIGQLSGEPVLATGPNDRYTRQSRAVLLEPSDGSGAVQWLRFAAGLALGEDEHQPDPMACFREGSNGLVRVTFTEGRAVWRDLPALVPSPQGGDKVAFRAALVVESAAALHALTPSRQRGHQRLLVAGVASDHAKLLRWRVEQFRLPEALLVEPDRAMELRVHIALADEVHRQLRQLAIGLVAGTLPDPDSKDTRNRARDMVGNGPLASTFFAGAERQLWALMACIAEDKAEAADVLWHGALRDAANLAWQRQLGILGHSVRALRSEAQCRGRLYRLLRQQLPAAFPADTVAVATARAKETITQGE
ncbi:MAG: type I-E CRISPR-associated protein Cse1/CasA [Burkholderiales bacterium]|nr:type I-E CRISPR-associated protein Cse1/CasA [Burkholderiales bacterium]